LFQTPLLGEYLPVSRLARLGQHNGFGTKAFENVIPLAASLSCTVGIAHRVSNR